MAGRINFKHSFNFSQPQYYENATTLGCVVKRQQPLMEIPMKAFGKKEYFGGQGSISKIIIKNGE